MKNLKYSLFLLFVLSVVSCDEDRFSSTKTIDFPEHESLLAVTAHLAAPSSDPNAGITIPKAFVSHSLGILDQSDYEIIDDASVRLLKNGNPFYELEYQESDGNYRYNGTPMNITAGEYTLEVDAPNYDPVKATQTLPSKAEVISATYEFEKVPFDFYYELFDLFKIKIKDPAGEQNYYSFQVLYEIKNTVTNETFIRGGGYSQSDDPLMEYAADLRMVLPDITFDGATYEVRLLDQTQYITYGNDEEIVAVIADIKTVTKDRYTYERSRELNWEADGNPFAEPVLIHSNMEGGLGVFTLENSVRYRLEL